MKGYICIFTGELKNKDIQTTTQIVFANSKYEARGIFSEMLDRDIPPHTRGDYGMFVEELGKDVIQAIKEKL